MAKRRATARTRKAARKTKKTATRKASTQTRRAAARKPAPRAQSRKGARPAKKRAGARRSGAARPAARSVKSGRAKSARPAKTARPAKSARSAKTATSAKTARQAERRPKPAALGRDRRRLREDETLASPPSTLGYARRASGAESGHRMYDDRKREHTEGGPALTGGDVDVDWGEAYSSGEETPGGDMPTPDQDVVEQIGRALGVEYEDAEELKGADKIEERDRHRWEYDPASAEDYRDRNRKE